MKIAIVMPQGFRFNVDRRQSIESVIRIFADHLRSENEIVVLCDGAGKKSDSIESIEVDPKGGRYIRNRRVVKLLRDLKPDLVEVHQNMLSANQIATALPDIPCIIYRHALNKRPKNWFKRRVHLYRHRNLAGFIFVSDFLKIRFDEYYPQFSNITFAVQNAINIDPWLGDVKQKQNLIAFGGRAEPEKGFAEICQALPTILARYPDWRFEMCADNWECRGDYSETQVSKLKGFGDRFVVRTNQPLTSVQKMLKAAAISLMPSVFEEPFGLAALEAHIAGAALISSGRGGLREASGSHAEYLRDVDAASLVESISKLIDNPSERIKLARSGQKYVLDQHVAKERASKLQSVRQQVVDSFVRK